MEEIRNTIMGLKLTEQKYRILVAFIEEKAKQGYINNEELMTFINILEDKKDGKEDEE